MVRGAAQHPEEQRGSGTAPPCEIWLRSKTVLLLPGVTPEQGTGERHHRPRSPAASPRGSCGARAAPRVPRPSGGSGIWQAASGSALPAEARVAELQSH